MLDPANKHKSLLSLKYHDTHNRIELLTADEQVICRARNQLNYQNEPVGTIVHAYITALGGHSNKQRIFHLERLVPSLNGLWGWKFKLGISTGTFEVEVCLASTESNSAEEVLNRLQIMLDYLAFCLEVGFHIQHSSVTSIPRLGPYISGIGPEERMVDAVSHDVSNKIVAIQSCSEVLAALRGLNEAYIESTMPGRLSRLWAAAEEVFGGKPKSLLTNHEIVTLVSCAQQISSLKDDPKRLDKLKNTLKDVDRLPLESRNERMANNIASTMNISFEKAYHKVRTASKLRGKHLHSISRNQRGDMGTSEEFLQKALRSYLTQAGVP